MINLIFILYTAILLCIKIRIIIIFDLLFNLYQFSYNQYFFENKLSDNSVDYIE